MELNLRYQLATHLETYDRQQAESNACQFSPFPTTTRVSYGTAGFRGNSAQIKHLFYNVGLISALRCLKLNANVGIMITASHNPVQDNGVKLIDSNGEMLDNQWEHLVEEFCNTHSQDKILEQLESLVKRFNIDTATKRTHTCRVLIGMDTRPSSEALAALVKQGLGAWAPIISFKDYGILTTPALHYLVAESNRLQVDELSLKCYYDQLISGLERAFTGPSNRLSGTEISNNLYSSTGLVVDCANGVGSETMQYFCKSELFNKCLPAKLINTGEGILNNLCGADYVKTTRLPPSVANDTEKRYTSLDGDADRVVYFYLDKSLPAGNLKVNLLDGDKIMALYAIYLKDILKGAKLDRELKLGIVQTAYANGASTDFMSKNLGLKIDFVDTGVKNLHKQAVKYDLGVYFEANGHGTIFTSPKVKSTVDRLANINDGDDNSKRHIDNLRRLLGILNNYTGDAISNILVVETILKHYDWDVKKWYNLYHDRPSSLIKVEVNDRNLIKTTNAARTCTEPKTLQPVIDTMVSEFGSEARCFVRPSGTENVVRIYAEAGDQVSADKLAASVGDKVKELCNLISEYQT